MKMRNFWWSFLSGIWEEVSDNTFRKTNPIHLSQNIAPLVRYSANPSVNIIVGILNSDKIQTSKLKGLLKGHMSFSILSGTTMLYDSSDTPDEKSTDIDRRCVGVNGPKRLHLKKNTYFIKRVFIFINRDRSIIVLIDTYVYIKVSCSLKRNK